ncbi:hypothetical protein LSAT2_008039 [Lamellibrachia satsuma]|nr:hypothetical protein LSAT2_008039 [Lamellibrachia satsuma]
MENATVCYSKDNFRRAEYQLTRMTLTENVPRLAVFSVILLFAASVHGVLQCTEKVTACMQPIINLSENGTAADMITGISLETMEELCTRYKQFGECVAPFKTSCSSTLSLIFESFDSGLGYLCEKEHLDEYAKHAACLSKTELGEKTLSCTKKYADDMAALVQEVGNSRSSFNSKACVLLYDYLDCVKKATSSLCSDDTAKYIRGLTEHFFHPIIDRMSCAVEAASGVGRVNTNGVLVAVIMLVLPMLATLGM